MVETSRVFSSPLAEPLVAGAWIGAMPFCARRPCLRRRIYNSAGSLFSRPVSHAQAEVREDAELPAQYIERRSVPPAHLRHAVPIPRFSWTRASESSSFHRRVAKSTEALRGTSRH
jgi:hypothetical protein